MIRIEKTINHNEDYSYIYNNDLPSILDFELEDTIFFDIETTGLSKNKNMIYLIGLAYFQNNIWNIKQYLATSLDDEKTMIDEFLHFISNKKFLIHFNGNSFDIPFINHKSKIYNLDNHPLSITSIDLYTIFKQNAKYLNFDNFKLTTIEKNFQIHRKDKNSGKELIKVYYEFIKLYSLDVLKNDFQNSNHLKKALLLHNLEDIVNLIPLLKVFNYTFLTSKNINFIKHTTKDDYIIFHYTLSYNHNLEFELPCPLSYEIKSTDDNTKLAKISTEKSSLKIHVRKIFTTLKYFYPNYKDYYYLPAEDTAIHKSVGQYVDKDYRENAKANNCYLKKEATFIPIPHKTNTFNIFKNSNTSNVSYIELTDKILNEQLQTYANELLKFLI